MKLFFRYIIRKSALISVFVIIIFAIAYTVKKINLNENTSPSNSNINVYTNANANMLSPVVQDALARVYVPNGLDNTVSVIDPNNYRVIDTFRTGKLPQHIVPSYDLKTLWVANNNSDTLTAINPYSGKPGNSIAVNDPYNLYFTSDGKSAMVMCEADKRIDFRDPHTMLLQESVPVQCRGINHMDFTADGHYAVATCEFSGQLLKINIIQHKVISYLSLHLNNSTTNSMPQDIRLSPDGRFFYVADMALNGVFIIDANSFTQVVFIPTGIGTHSVYPSRDGKFLYIANRGCNSMSFCKPHGPGSIAVIDPQFQKVVAIWPVPGGGSPDMGNVNANGNELWLSGRFDNEVYVFDTHTGKLLHRIPVGRGPHGLTVWPLPGRYSLGHTGNMR